jgi:sulfur-oxidizing protein SoxY
MRRRDFLAATGAVAGTLALRADPASATPEQAQEAIRALVGGGTLRKGRVKLDLPPLVENGNAVPLTVTVDSAMSAMDRVRAIHVIAEKNPQPVVAVLRFGPRAGRAAASTRIRLADSQTVVAVAEMADGSFWSGSAEAVVTMSACVEGI